MNKIHSNDRKTPKQIKQKTTMSSLVELIKRDWIIPRTGCLYYKIEVSQEANPLIYTKLGLF